MQRQFNRNEYAARAEKGARRFNAIRANSTEPITDLQFSSMSATRLMARAEACGMNGQYPFPQKLLQQACAVGLSVVDMFNAVEVGVQAKMGMNATHGDSLALHALVPASEVYSHSSRTLDSPTYPYQAIPEYPLGQKGSTVTTVRTATLHNATKRLNLGG